VQVIGFVQRMARDFAQQEIQAQYRDDDPQCIANIVDAHYSSWKPEDVVNPSRSNIHPNTSNFQARYHPNDAQITLQYSQFIPPHAERLNDTRSQTADEPPHFTNTLSNSSAYQAQYHPQYAQINQQYGQFIPLHAERINDTKSPQTADDPPSPFPSTLSNSSTSQAQYHPKDAQTTQQYDQISQLYKPMSLQDPVNGYLWHEPHAQLPEQIALAPATSSKKEFQSPGNFLTQSDW
jgi:hypothetical protein